LILCWFLYHLSSGGQLVTVTLLTGATSTLSVSSTALHHPPSARLLLQLSTIHCCTVLIGYKPLYNRLASLGFILVHSFLCFFFFNDFTSRLIG
jgi:hypothetical protein